MGDDAQVDSLVDQTSQHSRQPGDQRIEINGFATHSLAPTEGQQLAHQRGGTLRSPPNFIELAICILSGSEFELGKLQESRNDLQEVVEVVRHTSGQLPDGFHSLGVPVLLLQLPHLRDVGCRTQNPVDLAVGVNERNLVGAEPEHPTVSPVLRFDDPELGRSGFHHLAVVPHVRLGFGVGPRKLEIGLAHDLLRPVQPSRRGEGAITAHVDRVGVFPEDHAGEMVEDILQHLPAGPEDFFCPNAVGNVSSGREDPPANRNRAPFEVAVGTVTAPVTVDEIEHPLLLT